MFKTGHKMCEKWPKKSNFRVRGALHRGLSRTAEFDVIGAKSGEVANRLGSQN
jgi:hypothetical protein